MNLENFTTQSEYLPLASVCIRPVANAFRSEQNLSSAWKSLNYLGLPDYTKALLQYQNFQKILEEHAGEILPMPYTDGLSPDCLYCRDASIATDHGMILCRMGKPARRGEPADHKVFYEAHGIPILGSIEAPGNPGRRGCRLAGHPYPGCRPYLPHQCLGYRTAPWVIEPQGCRSDHRRPSTFPGPGRRISPDVHPESGGPGSGSGLFPFDACCISKYTAGPGIYPG